MSLAVLDDYPYLTPVLLTLGSISLANFLYKLAGVFLQTFVLPDFTSS